jgi:hypothetical protein
MSSDGTYSGRGSRRADRDVPTAKRASAGAAVAILIVTAILGFGGGALFGNASGGEDPQAPAAAGSDGAVDATESPDAEEGTGGEETEPSADGALTLESSFDGGTAVAGEDGDDIEFTIRSNPPQDGLTVELERSLDGGATWEPFGTSGQVYTLDSDGTKTTSVWSGREGDNHLRVVEKDGSGNIVRESNVIVVTVVEG